MKLIIAFLLFALPALAKETCTLQRFQERLSADFDDENKLGPVLCISDLNYHESEGFAGPDTILKDVKTIKRNCLNKSPTSLSREDYQDIITDAFLASSEAAQNWWCEQRKIFIETNFPMNGQSLTVSPEIMALASENKIEEIGKLIQSYPSNDKSRDIYTVGFNARLFEATLNDYSSYYTQFRLPLWNKGLKDEIGELTKYHPHAKLPYSNFVMMDNLNGPVGNILRASSHEMAHHVLYKNNIYWEFYGWNLNSENAHTWIDFSWQPSLDENGQPLWEETLSDLDSDDPLNSLKTVYRSKNSEVLRSQLCLSGSAISNLNTGGECEIPASKEAWSITYELLSNSDFVNWLGGLDPIEDFCTWNEFRVLSASAESMKFYPFPDSPISWDYIDKVKREDHRKVKFIREMIEAAY